MSMKQVFSAGIAAAVLLSSAANAETVSLNLNLYDDRYGGTFSVYNLFDQNVFGFSISVSSWYNYDESRYDHELFLSRPDLEVVDIKYSDLSAGTDGIARGYDGTAYRRYSFSVEMPDGRWSGGRYMLLDGNIVELSYSVASDRQKTYRTEYRYIDGVYEYYDGSRTSSPVSYDAFNLVEVFNAIQNAYPDSEALFDLQNTKIHFADASVSLAQIIGSDDMFFQKLTGGGTRYTDGDVSLRWFSGSPITSITVAYGIPAVPETETWAMLLAGLGLVGSIARRRRGLRA
jgi:MYXO-CTERM domain-containing protein